MNEYFNETIKLAKKSLKYGDVPIGAIVVKDGIIIGKGYNTREKHEKTREYTVVDFLYERNLMAVSKEAHLEDKF